MAVTGIQITGLPDANPILGSEFVIVSQLGVTSKTTVSALLDGLVGPPGPPGPAGGDGPPGPPGGFIIGTAVAPPIPNSILGTDATSLTAQVAGWSWGDGTTTTLATFIVGGHTVQIGDDTGANHQTMKLVNTNFGGLTLDLLYGGCIQSGGPMGVIQINHPGVAVTYNAGNPGNWTLPAPVDVWLALDRLAAWCAIINAALGPFPTP